MLPNITTNTLNPTLHILSGSFRSLSLFLLAFTPFSNPPSLKLFQTIPAYGPHQYLATNQRKDRVYATSWSEPAELSVWSVERSSNDGIRVNVDAQIPLKDVTASTDSAVSVSHLGNAPITAVSSYVTVPPPFTHIYSCGGPTGEVHQVSSDGGFGDKIQEFYFVDEDELASADKSRKALRTGSHGIEFSSSQTSTNGTALNLAFIPVLGTDSIEVYSHDVSNGLLTHIYTSPSPRLPPNSSTKQTRSKSKPLSYLKHATNHPIDGPRHVKVHPNGKILYSVTEHSNLLDIYFIHPPPPATSNEEWIPLKYISSRSLLPPHLSVSTTNDTQSPPKFRGDTLLLHPSTPSSPTPRSIFSTTRGSDERNTQGWLSIFSLNEDGTFASPSLTDSSEDSPEPGIERYQCPTSGGKAHAIDLYPKELLPSQGHEHPHMAMPFQLPIPPPPSLRPLTTTPKPAPSTPTPNTGVYIVLTDDSDPASDPSVEGYTGGAVRVLEWDGFGRGGVREVVRWPTVADLDLHKDGEWMRGGSHAIWLD